MSPNSAGLLLDIFLVGRIADDMKQRKSREDREGRHFYFVRILRFTQEIVGKRKCSESELNYKKKYER